MNSNLVRAVFDCGVYDLNILDGAECDFFKLLENMRFEGKDATMENIINEVFEEGRRIFRDSVEEWLETRKGSDTLSAEDYLALRLAEELGVDPENDITWYINMLDTHLYCKCSKQTMYEKIFSKQIGALQDFTGFDVQYMCDEEDVFEEQKDSILRAMWEEFGDVPVDNDGAIEENYYDFPAGTDREELWHWFDKEYSGGIAALMYGLEGEKQDGQERSG